MPKKIERRDDLPIWKILLITLPPDHIKNPMDLEMISSKIITNLINKNTISLMKETIEIIEKDLLSDMTTQNPSIPSDLKDLNLITQSKINIDPNSQNLLTLDMQIFQTLLRKLL